MTRSEVVYASGEPDENIQPRLSELSKQGFIKKSGERRPNLKGNMENVYIATQRELQL